MFRRLHIHMTLFSTLITGGILSLMAVACLLITENNIRQNYYTIFTNNAYSCISYLESQNVLSHRWIQQAKNNYGIDMQIHDGESPLFFDQLHVTETMEEIFTLAKEESAQNQGLNLDAPAGNQTLTKVVIFKIPGYYACTASIPKNGGILRAVLVHPLDTQSRQLFTLRLVFLVSVIAAILALAVFSWFFTQKMIQPLEQSRRQQTQFIASASHELRSPLAVILSSIRAMQDAPPAEAARFRDTIQSEGERMSRLVGDMLSLANADNQSWSIHPAPCELGTLLLEISEKYEPLMRSKKLSLSVELPDEELPPCICDPSQMGQVLGILLDNSLAYVPAGGKIRLSLSCREAQFLLTVSDNGPGIPDEKKEAVFQRFYRADAARKDKQHFGLGLCIAKEIVLLHKGEIQVQDAPGGGAEFVITLPL